MKKKKPIDLDSFNQSLLNVNQKAIDNIDSFTKNPSVKKAEKKLHKTVVKLFGK